MEKWDELERILKDNQLSQLHENILKQENWELNIRDAIDKAIQHWRLDNKVENELLDTLQRYNKIEMNNNEYKSMKKMQLLRTKPNIDE